MVKNSTKRKLIQLYTALLYNAYLKGFIKGEICTGSIKNVCVPGLNCYSCPGAIGACPLGAMQNALAASSVRAPWYMLGILLIFGLTLGRTICGWLCPFGLIQELVYKLPVPKIPKNGITRILSYIKYIILAVFVICIPIAYGLKHIPTPAFCKYICPAGTLEGAVGLLSNAANADKLSMLGPLFTNKFVILVLILLACVFLYRAFCRFLCPLGAIYGLFSKLSLLGVRVEASGCTGCGRCVNHCKMDIRHVGDHECINCGECTSVCPTQVISWKLGPVRFSSDPVKAGTKNADAVSADPAKAQEKAAECGDYREKNASGCRRSVILWICALAFLAFVLWYVNRPLPADQPGGNPLKPAAVQTQSGSDGILTTVPETEAGTDGILTTVPETEAGTDGILTTTPETADESGTELAPAAVLQAETEPESESDANPAVTASSAEDKAEQKESADASIPVGPDVGMRCPQFTVSLYGEGDRTFTLSDDPGKPVVINFWATWCAPCIAELPHFEELEEKYKDQIEVIAIHSNMVTEDVQKFIDAKKLKIQVGQDPDGSVIASYGGSTMLPMTVVVDPQGIIVYNKVGSVTFAKLEDLVQPLLSDSTK